MKDIYAVQMKNISMEFPGVQALQTVDFDLKPGEVHVLLGENGAGKSTLMKILTGVYEKKSGEVFLFGEKVNFSNPSQAIAAGIATIYQELNLIPFLSVAENIYLNNVPKTRGFINWSQMYSDTNKQLSRIGTTINPKTEVSRLGVGERQMVEIAKAMTLNAKVLIMDEPSSALTDKEVDSLFSMIRTLKELGTGIVYISHRLEEVKKIGDRATILRDGRFVKTVEIDKTKMSEMISMMVGREIGDYFPKEEVEIGREVLRAENISTKTKLRNCSLSVRGGEILGISGLMGAGRTELMAALTGVDRRVEGTTYLEDKRVNIKTFKDAVKNGIGFLTEDRKVSGLILNMDVKSNISLVNLKRICKGIFLSYKKEQQESVNYIDSLNIKTPSVKQRTVFLSGGNQQKVVIAKWLFSDCKVLIFDEPTRGIDIGAKIEIYKIIGELVKKGVAVIMVSSELPEILGMSDRILVMHEGRVMGELSRKEATEEKILYLAMGGEKLYEKK